MGFKIKAPKIKAPKISIKADPSKLISKASEGITNTVKAVTIDPAVGLAKGAVSGVGQVMSDPAAAPLLGAAAAAFGGPAAGLMASQFASGFPTKQKNKPSEAPAAPVVIESSGGEKSDYKLPIMIGGGLGALVLIILLMKKGK